ncbi:MAG: hypothetical protein MJZ16_01980 [Bacteroidales bacterium]|nr:hypothetical protein [Bacteroidales bacterium]
MRTNNYSAKTARKNNLTAMVVLTGTIVGAVADIAFGLPLLGTSLGAGLSLWLGAAAQSIVETAS